MLSGLPERSMTWVVGARPTGTASKFRLSQVAVSLPDFQIQLHTAGQLAAADIAASDDISADVEVI